MKAKCYLCREKPVRSGSRFCTQRCAADFAEELVEGNDDYWCSKCCSWIGDCEHKSGEEK